MTSSLVLVQAVSLLRKRDLQYDRMNRMVRVICGFGQTLLLAYVEILRIEPPLLRYAVAYGKVAVFSYFFVGGRLDAKWRWRFLVVPGVWEVHDNLHVLAFAIHLAQVYAVGLPARAEGAFC
jgi:hypothetical protein